MNRVLQRTYIGVLAPRISECDFTWKQGIYRDNRVKMRSEVWIFLRLIHVDILQKTTHYCKSTIPQLKINKFKFKKDVDPNSIGQFSFTLPGLPTDCIINCLLCAHVKSLQLCITLCDPVDCSPPGSSVYGIF